MIKQTKVGASGSAAPRALQVLVVLVVVGGLAPGIPVGSWGEAAAALRAGTTLAIQDPALVTLIERFATFLPLGWLSFRHFARRGTGNPIRATCFAVSLLALVLELAQGAIQHRHARLSDFVLAVGFGLVGMAIGAWLGAEPVSRDVRRLLALAVVLGNVLVALIVFRTIQTTRLTGWNCAYPLLVANERSGERPWLGRVRGLAIYPRALGADEIREVVDAPFSPGGADARAALGAVAFYSFAAVHSGRIPQLLDHQPSPDLLVPPPDGSSWRVAGDALEVRGPTTIRSAGPARELCEAITVSKEFTAEVQITSGGMAQSGPARIVSQSSDIMHRNFTLGEELGRLVVRVRTPWNGRNGINLPLEAEAEALSDGWHHVAFGYDRHGAAFLFLDGVQVARISYPTMFRVGPGTAIRIAVVVGSFLGATGAAASLLVRRRTWLVELALVYGALLPAVAVVGLSVWFGHVRDQLLLVAAAVAPGVGMIGARTLTAASVWQPRTTVDR